MFGKRWNIFYCCETWHNCFRLWVHFSAIIFHAGPQTHLTRRHSPLFPLKIPHTHTFCLRVRETISTVKSYVNLCIKYVFFLSQSNVAWTIVWYSNIILSFFPICQYPFGIFVSLLLLLLFLCDLKHTP